METQAYGLQPKALDPEFVRRLDQRLSSLKERRNSWWQHWADLARYILPRRYRALCMPNTYDRGRAINQHIIDGTASIAARTLASGMMAGITSPSRPWFRLTIPDRSVASDPDVKAWVAEVQDRMMHVLATSNFYQCKAMQYMDQGVFGTAPLFIYEDYEDVIRCYVPPCGEYYAAVGAKLEVTTLAREAPMTTFEIIDEFGTANVGDVVRQQWDQGGAGWDQEHMIYQLVEPNPDYVADDRHIGPGGIPRQFRYREYYWQPGQTNGKMLRARGFHEQPFSCARWDVCGNDAYGRSPGMDALGDIKQLQLETRRKAQALDKMVNPPMVADPSLKNEPASILPGAVTYASSMLTGDKSAFRPAYQINPPLGEITADLVDVRQRIRDTFFNNLFLMISQLETVRTATEIDARREEQLIQLGPVLERNQSEVLSVEITRVFKIMSRFGLLPAPPDAVRRGGAVKVEYISMLAEAQRATSVTSLERLWQFAGSIAAAKPRILDNLDEDASIQEYSDYLRVSPKVMADPRRVRQVRAERAQQEQQAKQMQQASVAVQGAETLSKTDVGGGQNALALMLGAGAANGA